MEDFTIVNAKVWVEGEIIEGWVHVEDGIISKVMKGGGQRPYGRAVDANGLLVIPGLIDVHVHLRDSSLSYKEDFRSGTAAAVAGGFTTILDMPNTSPPVTTAKRLRERIGKCKDRIYADVGFLATPLTLKDVKDLVREDCVAFKVYMARRLEGEDYSSLDLLKELALTIKPFGKVLAVHAEDPNLIGPLPEDYGSLEHSKARPETAELSAVSISIEAARLSGAKVHVCHISLRRSVEALAEAKGKGIDVSLEATPHHTFLSLEGHSGKTFVVEPPLRTTEDSRAIMEAVEEGRIEIIASDHAPHSIAEKLSEKPPPGFPGLEIALPIFMTAVHEGKLSLKKVLEAMTINPAKRFGLPKIGEVREGNFANLAFIDPKSEWKIDSSKFLSKAKYSPFEGKIVRGRVVKTLVRGQEVFSQGELVGKGGEGKPVS